MSRAVSSRTFALRRLVLLLALLVAFAAWLQSPALSEAHATLVRSDPPVNARLTDPPTVVTAFFSESLDNRLSSMQVFDGAGNRVDSGEVTFGPDPAQMSVAVQKLDPTFYAVQWKTLSSSDGHLLKGSIPFTVLNPDGTEPSGPHPSAEAASSFSLTSARPGDVITKWVNLLGVLLVVGGLGFALAVAGPASRSLSSPLREESLSARRRHLAWAVWPGLGLLGVTAAAELLLQATRLGGLGFLDDVLRTDWGDRWIQRQVLVALLVAAFATLQIRGARAGRAGEMILLGMFAGGSLYLLLVAMVSHGSSIPGSFWATAVEFIHLLGATVWIGMLVQLLLLLWWVLRQRPAEARDELLLGHLRRFSPFAATSVVLLLASGSANALAQLPDLSALFDTVYGQVLIVKLSITAATLLVAAVNAVYLRPRLTSGSASSSSPEAAAKLRAQLWRVVRIEISLAIVVLLVTAALVQYPTSRQQRSAETNVETASEAAQSFDSIQTAGDVDVQLSISPNQVGTNSYLLYLFPPSTGEPAKVLRVRLRFESPDSSVGPEDIIAEETGKNSYKAIGPFFNSPGAWTVRVELRRAEVDDVSAVFNVGVTGIGATAKLDRFAFPLEVGSWAAVGAVGAVLVAILTGIWIALWPGRRPTGGRPTAVEGRDVSGAG